MRSLKQINPPVKNKVAESIDGTTVTVINQHGQNVSLIDWYTKDLKFTGTMASKLQDFMQNSPQKTYCGLQGTIDAVSLFILQFSDSTSRISKTEALKIKNSMYILNKFGYS